MKIQKILILIFSMFVFSCGSKSTDSTPIENNQYGDALDVNVMSLLVGNCGPDGYANEPCVSLKVCTPGTQNCQIIPNILLDTGSYGLRIFSSVLKVPLQPVNDSKLNPIAECAQFGSSNTWGSVQVADVVLAKEDTVSVPIQVIDANFQKLPSACTSPDASPAGAGYNGILGVGVLEYDCGQDCVIDPNLGVYFSCAGGVCTSTSVPLAKQIANPVSRLSIDNNGVIVDLPSVPNSGVASLRGTLTIGIDTRANNKSDGTKLFKADGFGNFQTDFLGTNYPESFIDSGSNGLFFPAPKDMVTCNASSTEDGFYCPVSPKSLTATQIGSDLVMKVDVAFQVANASSVLNSYGPAVGAFSNLAGTQTASFDWGLPFFFGRRVLVGIESKSSNLTSGPYWAW